MSRKSFQAPVDGGVKKSIEESKEVDLPKTIGEPSTPRPNTQYRPNNDPSQYLYGNPPPSTPGPWYSMADWNNQNNNWFQFEGSSPEASNGTNTLGNNMMGDQNAVAFTSVKCPTSITGGILSHSTTQIASQTASTTNSAQVNNGQAEDDTVEDSGEDTDIPYGQGQGEVGWDNGTMFWREIRRDDTREAWQPAVYHHEIREELIASANAQGTYDFRRDRGLAEHDVTSYLAAQKTWKVEDRNHRPDILFQWKKTGYRNPTYIVPDWYHKGSIVLDPQNCPVRKYRNIPDTCSSMLEGGVMEAIKREDGRIVHQDFVARMMPEILIHTSRGRVLKPLYGANAMAARMRRFRERACCIVWGARAGSDKILEHLENLVPAQCIMENSTRNFRDLYDHEILELRKPNAGKFAERAGKRAINESERKVRAKKRDAVIERRKEQFHEGQQSKREAVERKRKREALKDTVTEEIDEADVSGSVAGGRAIAPMRKQRKMNHPTTIGVSRKRKADVAGWHDISFKLGHDGDDDEGCAKTNADHQGVQSKRLKPNHHSSASATSSSDSSMTTLEDFLATGALDQYDDGTTLAGSSNHENTCHVHNAAATSLVESPQDVWTQVFPAGEDTFNFGNSFPNKPIDTSNVNTSDVAAVDDDVTSFEAIMARFNESYPDDSNLPSVQLGNWDALLGPGIEPNAEPNVELNVETNVEPNDEPNIKPNVETNVEPNVEPNTEETDLFGADESYFDEFLFQLKSDEETNVEHNVEPNVEPNTEGTGLLGADESFFDQSYFEEFMFPLESDEDEGPS